MLTYLARLLIRWMAGVGLSAQGTKNVVKRPKEPPTQSQGLQVFEHFHHHHHHHHYQLVDNSCDNVNPRLFSTNGALFVAALLFAE